MFLAQFLFFFSAITTAESSDADIIIVDVVRGSYSKGRLPAKQISVTLPSTHKYRLPSLSALQLFVGHGVSIENVYFTKLREFDNSFYNWEGERVDG